MKWAIHDAANIFPIDSESIKSLADDIKANGQLVPIELMEGQVIDGRRRLKACELAGVDPVVVEVSPDDPIAYVVSLNLHRRHLNESQRALVGARIKERYAKDAKARQVRKPKSAVANLPQQKDVGKSRDAAAAVVNVGGRSVDYAAKVLKHGSTKLIAAVESGDIPVAVAAKLADEPKATQVAAVASVENGKTPAAALRDVNALKHKRDLEAIETVQAKETQGVFDVIVVDPPWPIAKVSRDVRPQQSTHLDYPTMSVEDIAALTIPASDSCHLFCWTTHRFLPDAFSIVRAWGFAYSACFVWHKAGGFQPVGLPQFNCEFCLYCRKGNPTFIDLTDFKVCFTADRGKHSEKPEAFYELLRRVTAGRRLDMFNRRPIVGFESWGNQSER